MQFKPITLPMSKNGMPWGTIILAVVIIGGVGLITYNVMKKPELEENYLES